MYKKASLITAAFLAASESYAMPYPAEKYGRADTTVALPCYSQFDQTKFIQWTKANPDWKNAPVVRIKIGDYTLDATVDTGSTGIVIGSKYGPKREVREKKCKQGQVFYSSSNWLQQGWWCDLTVDVSGVVTHAEALIRTLEVCCPGFDSTTDGERCPAEKRKDPCVCKGTCKRDVQSTPEAEAAHMAEIEARDDEEIGKAYMGVGFGRGVLPKRNLFMNVLSIDGDNVKPERYRQGYVITSDGISLGITKQNTANFGAVKLSLMPNTSDRRDWNEPAVAIQIDGGAWKDGTFLADTGIPNSYVTGSQPHTKGSKIAVRLPSATNPIASADIESIPKGDTYSGTNKMQPTWVGRRSVPGINIGRHFYNEYDLFFDGDGGYFGCRQK